MARQPKRHCGRPGQGYDRAEEEMEAKRERERQARARRRARQGEEQARATRDADRAARRAAREAQDEEQARAAREEDRSSRRVARAAETEEQATAAREENRNAHMAARAAEAESGVLPNGLAERCAGWNKVKSLRKAWRTRMVKSLLNMMMCAYCGYVVLAGCGSNNTPMHGVTSMRKEMATAERSPYELANAGIVLWENVLWSSVQAMWPNVDWVQRKPPGQHMLSFVRTGSGWRGDGEGLKQWHVCNSCSNRARRVQRVNYLVAYSISYLQDFFQLGPMGRQYTAVLDGRVAVQERWHGFASATFGQRKLFDQPLMVWTRDISELKEMLFSVKSVLQRSFVRGNPILEQYLAMAEHDHPRTSLPMLDRRALQMYRDNERERGGEVMREEDMAAAHQMELIVTDTAAATHTRLQVCSSIYELANSTIISD